mmetsp:Transcript_24837/g.48596  ORF Transcript_24837/g.48596 Transcript_24837/m.48596 type:complete len:85 (-) Transcript_24837:656-910(-)
MRCTLQEMLAMDTTDGACAVYSVRADVLWHALFVIDLDDDRQPACACKPDPRQQQGLEFSTFTEILRSGYLRLRCLARCFINGI